MWIKSSKLDVLGEWAQDNYVSEGGVYNFDWNAIRQEGRRMGLDDKEIHQVINRLRTVAFVVNARRGEIQLQAQTFDPEHAGIWVDADNGITIAYKIQEIAREHGWDGHVIENPEDEMYFEMAQEAEDYLQAFAPQGYVFGTNEDGHWGLWDEEEVVEFSPEIGLPEEVAPPVEMGIPAEPGEYSTTEALNPEMMASMGVHGQQLSEDDAGPWIDSSRGIYMGVEIQKIAQERGWEGAQVLDPKDEVYFDASHDAEDYLQSIAPDGYYFGTSEQGDWGLWRFEEEEGEPEAFVKKFANVWREKMRVEAQNPTTPPPDVLPNQVARWNESKQQWDVVPKEGIMGPTASDVASSILNDATIASEFQEEVFPEDASEIKEDDRVVVKNAGVLGDVIRIVGNAYRVKHKGGTATYWRQELIKVQKK